MHSIRKTAALLGGIALLLTLGTHFVVGDAQAAKPLSSGAAELHQIGGSGIRAKITFTDNGNTLSVRGRATGMDPTVPYISLVYDAGAKPSGPSACLPATPGMLSQIQMFVGAWVVDAEGNGVLIADKSGLSYVALGDLGAMSVRNAITRSLHACGKTHGLP